MNAPKYWFNSLIYVLYFSTISMTNVILLFLHIKYNKHCSFDSDTSLFESGMDHKDITEVLDHYPQKEKTWNGDKNE